MREIVANPVLTAALLSWATAQASKLVYHVITKRRLDFRLLVSAGGMPSSHSAFVAALATAVGIREGVDSTPFAIAIVLAVIVMFDAAGVRRAASIQARILNQIIDELFQGHPISERRLRELIGHTPIQVFVGAGLGIALSWLWMK